ncbi:hypothetical protein L210DRAFT_3507861 [Boletus edulis BED1]|uniref:Uncharacterized protein n=1 Tax=Boletus edulis BED1 TaxID=1328754 RepID=A0AAD4G8X9_BOLED|nr:hypothetical protein L210DRAFT_3507861 [Boletus edulis BED1]
MYNTGHPQRRPGGVPTPILPESQFNFDAAPVSPHTTYRQPQIPMENPQVPVIESGGGPTVHDDPLIPTGGPHSAPQTHSSLLQNYNDGGYVQYPNPQGYMMRGAPTPGPGGSPVTYSNPFPQQHTPYLSARGQTPYYDQPSRLSQRGDTPFDDYPSSYSGSCAGSIRGSVPPPSYHRGSQSSIDTPSRDEMASLCNEVRRLAEEARNQDAVNSELKKVNKELTESLNTTKTELAQLHEQISELAQLREQMSSLSKPKPAKDGSNRHPALKTVGKEGHVQEFLGVHPLERGEAFEEVEGTKVWHPDFKGSVSDRVNRTFIKALVKAVCENEKNSGKIPDEDFKEDLVRSCAKTYFRNIHKSFAHRTVPEQAGAIKYQESSERAPLVFAQPLKPNGLWKGVGNEEGPAVEVNECKQDHLTLTRIKLTTIKFVAFVRHLAFKVAGGKQNQPNQNSSLEGQTTSGSATGIGQPPQKKRRTTKTTKQPVKTVWDAPPSMMHKRPPKSSKKPVATRPFSLMVDPKWQEAHPSLRPLTPNPHVQEPTWLANFYDEVKEGKYPVMQGDLEYLKELDDWRQTVVESGDEADEQDVDADVEDEGNPGADEEASEGDVE